MNAGIASFAKRHWQGRVALLPTCLVTCLALRIAADGVNALRSPDRAFLVITHYQRLLDVVAPDRVSILAGGRIVQTGGPELALRLEEEGYDAVMADA